MNDCWLNPDGYDDPLLPRLTWWDKMTAREVRRFKLDPVAPLTLCLVNGDACDLWQPGREFDSDGASIPRVLTWIPGYSRTAYERAAYLHDGEHRVGRVWHARLPAAVVSISLRNLGEHGHAAITRYAEFAPEASHSPAANERYRRALVADGCPPYRARIQHAVLTAVGVRW